MNGNSHKAQQTARAEIPLAAFHLQRHANGPRVYVLRRRVHEYQLGLAFLVVALATAFVPPVACSLASAVGALGGLWLVVKDWPDLFPSTRDTACWSFGIHRPPRRPLELAFGKAPSALLPSALCALLAALVFTPAGLAHEDGVVLTGSGTAAVDGTLDPEEWAPAREFDFDANVGGVTTPARLLIMNDAQTMFVALRVSKLPPGPMGEPRMMDDVSLAVDFDSDHSNTFGSGDDVLIYNHAAFGAETFFDEFLYPIDWGPGLNGTFDTTDPSPLPPPGTSEIEGASSADETGITIEMSHPLDSPDDLHDFSVAPGDTLGFRMNVTLWTPAPLSSSSTTSVPGFEDLGDVYVSRGMPETHIDSAPLGLVRSTAATVTFSGSAGITAGFSCSLDGAQWTTCVSPLELTSLSQGPHTMRLRAEDEAGYADSTPAERSWTVDTVPPNTRIRSGPSGTVTTHKATFRFRSGEADSTFTCKLDARPKTSCTSPTTYRRLHRGEHVFRVWATDPAGNRDLTPAKRRWTIL